MIFGTLEEANRVRSIVEARGTFEELTDSQNAFIRGMYRAIEAVENSVDYVDEDCTTLEKIVNEVSEEAVENAVTDIELAVEEIYVTFSEINFSEENEVTE